MPAEILLPETEAEWLALRAKDVTASEVAALFGVSPYLTRFELWHRKRSGVPAEIADNERMKWGRALENVIARTVEAEKGWVLDDNGRRYFRLPEFRAGATPDFFGFAIEGDPTRFVLEVKNVDGLQYAYTWTGDEAPPHIEFQVQHQMWVTGAAKCFIVALVGGNREVIIERKADPVIQEAIARELVAFWKSVDAGIAPIPDFASDAEFIAQVLYNRAEPGKVIQATDKIIDLVDRWKAFDDDEKIASVAKKAAKAELLTVIGEAEKVFHKKFSIHAGMVEGKRIEFDREPYRLFRIDFKKEKPA